MAQRQTILRDLLEGRRPLVADGGMGTGLQALGLMPGDSPERWNRAHPERVALVHHACVGAGADLILTNTFGGNSRRLALAGLEEHLPALNRAGAEIALSVAAAADRPLLVAGSIGPTGELLAPLGTLTPTEATSTFAAQAAALAEAGVDLLWIETMSSLDELSAAHAGAARTSLPIVATMSFGARSRTIMGVAPQDLAAWWASREPRPVVIGANCGAGPAEVVVATAALAAAAPGMLLAAKANCGVPTGAGGEIHYPAQPDDMAEYARLALDAGAHLVGACCGGTAAHIAAIRHAVDGHRPTPLPSFEQIRARLG